jgi:hypothetical protein
MTLDAEAKLIFPYEDCNPRTYCMIEWHDRMPSCYVMYLTMAQLMCQ